MAKAEWDVTIRPVRIEDAKDVHALRVMAGVRETILALPSERLSDTEDFIRNTKEHLMVAEVDGRVVGMAGLIVPFMAATGSSGAITEEEQ